MQRKPQAPLKFARVSVTFYDALYVCGFVYAVNGWKCNDRMRGFVLVYALPEAKQLDKNIKLPGS